MALSDVLNRLVREEADSVLVRDQGSVVGIITPRDIRRLRRYEQLGVDEGDDKMRRAA